MSDEIVDPGPAQTPPVDRGLFAAPPVQDPGPFKAQGYICPSDGQHVTCTGYGNVLSGKCDYCSRTYEISVAPLVDVQNAPQYGAPMVVHDPSVGVSYAAPTSLAAVPARSIGKDGFPLATFPEFPVDDDTEQPPDDDTVQSPAEPVHPLIAKGRKPNAFDQETLNESEQEKPGDTLPWGKGSVNV